MFKAIQEIGIDSVLLAKVKGTTGFNPLPPEDEFTITGVKMLDEKEQMFVLAGEWKDDGKQYIALMEFRGDDILVNNMLSGVVHTEEQAEGGIGMMQCFISGEVAMAQGDGVVDLLEELMEGDAE
jgi:hypothetical protein